MGRLCMYSSALQTVAERTQRDTSIHLDYQLTSGGWLSGSRRRNHVEIPLNSLRDTTSLSSEQRRRF